MKSILIKTVSMIALVGSVATAQQPKPSKTVENFNCQDGPKMNGSVPDTVATRLDSGFVSLFNGKDLTGWWENCTPHSSNKVKGGVWWPDADQGLLFSREEGPDGGILVTNQIYDHYEFIMDIWPTFGNDGGIFNRVTKSGKNWQTTIDYIGGSGVAGCFNEGSWAPTDINHDPFRFGGSGPENPTLPTSDGTWAMWTDFTKTQNPTSFGCSANGCTSADFVKIWDVAGWNQIRVKFYDGLEAGRSVNMETFIRKLGAPNWVPVYKSKRAIVTPKGPVALQIHGNGRWNAGTYNVYRNIKIRPLNVDGSVPNGPTSVLRAPTGKIAAPNLNIVGGMLTGMLDGEYDVTLTDIRGQVLEKFHAASGMLQHMLDKSSQGVFVATFKNNRGSARIRLSRI